MGPTLLQDGVRLTLTIILDKLVEIYPTVEAHWILIRNTLDGGSANAKTADWPWYGGIYFDMRTTEGGSTTEPGNTSATLPYWVKASRSGSTFSSYVSPDGVNWTQLGTSQTITMNQTVYVGLAANSGSTTASATATFDNVSITMP
jgi:hypothetical protein